MNPVLERLVALRRQHLEDAALRMHVDLSPEVSLTAPPMVLLLGNHSSGKSSLINHLLGRTIQRTGVAPTDDGFTFLLYGEDERNIDGQALTSNPDLPLKDLAAFGPGLVQHCYGRVLDLPILQRIRLIDSPGMIDAHGTNAERPYEFMKVVRWIVERADLVLLFFDPEKPGTTSETLSALTQALHGIDHKLHIVMNKMDLFDGIRDFARTYGALCWNLSRNLPTKDIPHIYTTVIPELARDNSELPLEGFAAALLELEEYIAALPQRRVDAVVSTVIDEAKTILRRQRVCDFIRRNVRQARLQVLLSGGALASAAGCVAWWRHQAGAAWYEWAAAALVALLLFVLGAWLARVVGRWIEGRHIDRLDLCFTAAYHQELNDRVDTDDLRHEWTCDRPAFERILRGGGLARFKPLSRSRIRGLRTLIDDELPGLR